MFYNIEEYYKNSDFQYFTNSFFYYMNNEKQFHDAHENKSSKNKNKIKFKNNVDVDFVVIFYYIIINKMNEKSIYRKCYKKFTFNNLLYIYFKSKSYRRKIIKFEKFKDKRISHDSTLMKKKFIIKNLKLIELITSSTFSNEISFHF